MASDWNLGEFLSQNAKVEALKTVSDDSSFGDRDSPMFKLLNSALYDMAKIAAVHCPVKVRFTMLFGSNFEFLDASSHLCDRVCP